MIRTILEGILGVAIWVATLMVFTAFNIVVVGGAILMWGGGP